MFMKFFFQIDRTINNQISWTNNFYYLISHPQNSYNTESHTHTHIHKHRSQISYSNRLSVDHLPIWFGLFVNLQPRQQMRIISHTTQKWLYISNLLLSFFIFIFYFSLLYGDRQTECMNTCTHTLDYEQWFLNCTIAEQWAFYCAVNIERIFLYTNDFRPFRKLYKPSAFN